MILPRRFDHFMNRLRGVVPVLALMLLSGCAVGPDYQRPEAAIIPDAYVGPGQDWKIADPQAHVPRGNWWEIFGDPELNQLEADAMAANQDLKAAVSRFEQARASANVAESALFPRIGISALEVDQRDSKHRPVGGKPDQTYDTLSVPFDFSYEIDLWGRVRRSVESATAQAQASADDVESIKLSIQAEVAADFITLRTLDADRGPAAFQHRGVSQIARSGPKPPGRRHGIRPGCGPGRDCFENRGSPGAGYRHPAGQISECPGGVDRKDRIPVSYFRNGRSICRRWSSLAGLPSELLERRPDIAATERRMAAANANIGVATAAFFPTVKLSGIAGFQSGGLDMLFDWPSHFWAVGPSVTLPLFQGGQLNADLRRTKAVYEETVAKYRQTVLIGFCGSGKQSCGRASSDR